MKKLLLPCLFALAAHSAVAADVTALGSWSQTINATHLVSGAGSTMINPESVSGVTTLTIGSLLVWSLRVRRSNGSWNSNATIWIKRTSNGSGLGTITGGTSYVQLTNTDVELCSGLIGGRSGVSMQFKVTGLSPLIPPGTYQSPVIFTLVAL